MRPTSSLTDRVDTVPPFEASGSGPETTTRPTPARAPRPSGTSASSRRRRKSHTSKREPVRQDFSDDESFDAAWHKWREDRDCNNLSVKRSRQRAKLRKLKELEVAAPAAGKSTGTKRVAQKAHPEPADSVSSMREELYLLSRFASDQEKLSTTEARQAKGIINKYLAEQRRGGGSE